MQLALFTISFDLEGADPSVYSDIYVWAHAQGGYHFTLLEDCRWGRLPSTCVVFPINTTDPWQASLEFATAVYKEFGYAASHCLAVPGEPGGFAVASVVPRYAKDRVTALKTNAIKSLVRRFGQ